MAKMPDFVEVVVKCLPGDFEKEPNGSPRIECIPEIQECIGFHSVNLKAHGWKSFKLKKIE
jgi:hypothetical protein